MEKGRESMVILCLLASINEEIPIELLFLSNFMHKNRVLIENLGNFCIFATKFEIYVLSKTYRRCNCTETEVIWSSACGRTKVLRKDNHMYVISEKFRETKYKTGYCYGENESKSHA